MEPNAKSTAPPSKHLATVHLDVEASPDQVWEAITTDDGLAGWMGDGATIADSSDGELVLPDVVTGRPRRGRVQHVDTARNLTYAWWPEDAPDAVTYVSIDLEEVDAGTRVTVVEHASPLASGARACASTMSPDHDLIADWAWRVAVLAVVGVDRRAFVRVAAY